MSTPPVVPLGPQFKMLTHIIAVVIVGIGSFAITPAGKALILQYPKLSVIVAAAAMLGTLYHTPKEPE